MFAGGWLSLLGAVVLLRPLIVAERQTLLFEIAYDGLAFHGVAPQPRLTTIVGVLFEHFEAVLGQRPRGMAVAARTDAGVSARRNYVSCWVRGVTDLEGLGPALCTRLDGSAPAALEVLRAWIVPRSVHARTAALGKHYRYTIEHGIPASALQTRAAGAPHVWCVTPVLDMRAMNAAAGFLVGSHDFSSFRAANCSAGSPQKTIESIRVSGSGCRLSIDVVGDAFLRRMVRILSGTLAEVGAGLRNPTSMQHIVEAQLRSAAGLTAPAHGLSLLDVRLDPARVWSQATPMHAVSP